MKTETPEQNETSRLLDILDRRAEEYAMDREELAETIREMEAQLAAVRDHFLPDLKKAAAHTAGSKCALEGTIDQHPELFTKPRTMQLHGIKFGYQSSKDKVEPGPNTVELIEKHFPEAAETLIKTTKEPVKALLKDMSPGDLQKLGCRRIQGEDQILIKSTTDAIDKVIEKILKDAAASAE